MVEATGAAGGQSRADILKDLLELAEMHIQK